MELKKKINLTKEPQNDQKNTDQIKKKKTYYKLRLNDQIENNLKFYIKKLKIQRIRIKLDISKNQRIIMKFYMVKQDFQGEERKKWEKKKTIDALP